MKKTRITVALVLAALACSLVPCDAAETEPVFGLVTKIIDFDHLAVVGDILSIGPSAGARPSRRAVSMRITEVLRGPFTPGKLGFYWREPSSDRCFDGTERDVLVFLADKWGGALGPWRRDHLLIPGTDYTQVVQFCKELEGIRDTKSEPEKWRALKDLLMGKLDSPSPWVAREALQGIQGYVLRELKSQEIERLLSVLEKGDPMREFDIVLALARWGKLDLAQRLVDYVDDADGLRTALRLDRDLEPSSPRHFDIVTSRRIAFVRELRELWRDFRRRVNTDPLFKAARSAPDRRGNAVLLLAGLKDPRAEALLVERLKKGHTEHREARALGLYQTRSAFKALVDLYSNPPAVKDPGKFRDEIVAGLLRIRSPESQAFLAKTGAVKAKTDYDFVGKYGNIDGELESERRADEQARSR